MQTLSYLCGVGRLFTIDPGIKSEVIEVGLQENITRSKTNKATDSKTL